MKIYYCELSRLYFASPCPARSALVYGHADVDVTDLLAFDDLDHRDLGYDLAAVRYSQLLADDRDVDHLRW